MKALAPRRQRQLFTPFTPAPLNATAAQMPAIYRTLSIYKPFEDQTEDTDERTVHSTPDSSGRCLLAHELTHVLHGMTKRSLPSVRVGSERARRVDQVNVGPARAAGTAPLHLSGLQKSDGNEAVRLSAFRNAISPSTVVVARQVAKPKSQAIGPHSDVQQIVKFLEDGNYEDAYKILSPPPPSSLPPMESLLTKLLVLKRLGRFGEIYARRGEALWGFRRLQLATDAVQFKGLMTSTEFTQDPANTDLFDPTAKLEGTGVLSEDLTTIVRFLGPSSLATPSSELVEYIASWEDFRAHAYDIDSEQAKTDPSKRNCTIGYGRLIHEGPCSPGELTLTTTKEAERLSLEASLRSTANWVLKSLDDFAGLLSQKQLDAVVACAYQGFKIKEIIALILAGRVNEVASLMATNKQPPNRGKANEDLFGGGAYTPHH